MAIGRISGQVLKSNLYREDVDISFSNFPGDTPLLYFNVSDNKLGVNTDTPTTELEILGTSTTTNLVATLSNLGDVEVQNNLIKSTAGDLNFESATVADNLVLNSNTNVTKDLTVDKTTFTSILDVAGGISLFAQGGLTPGSYSMSSLGATRSPSIAQPGDVLLTTDTANFVIQPAPGTVFGVEGDMRLDGSLTLEENTDLTFVNNAGDTVLSINGETGLLEPEELIVDNIYIHDNVVETLREGVDLILRSGPFDSVLAEESEIRIESVTTAFKPFNINGPDAKLVIDNELEIDGNTIESYASDLNFVVNNLGDSTVNTFNFFGNTNNYGFVYVDNDLTINDSLVTDTITSYTSDLTLSMIGKGKVVVDDELDVTRQITTRTISTLEARDLLIAPASKRTVFDDTIEVPDLISTRSIQGVLLDIDNVQIDGNTVTSTTGNLNIETSVPGTTFINFNSDLEVQGNIHATGTISADGDLILGDEDTDNITLNADINSNVLPDINSDGTTGYTLGAINKNWRNIFSRKITLDGYTADKIDNNEFNIEVNPSDTAVVTQGALARFVGRVTTGDRIPIGPPEDSTFDDGAFLRSAETDENGFPKLDVFDFEMKVSQAVDLLNESMNNVRNNTFIRSVDYSATPQAAGSGATVTLTLEVDGNHNRVEVDWDVTDVLVAQGAADPGKNQVYPSGTTTVSYTYNAPLGGLFTVRVVVRNTDAQFPGSAGTDAEEEKIDYIIIYTPDPVADFDLYRNPTGGSALAGNLLYVIEGESLSLENLTTNTGVTLGAGNTATYTVDWGDGTSADNVASDTDPGGRDGIRISHTFADGTTTSTGTATVTLTLATHSTADPTVIPTSATKDIKIYENDPLDPSRLDSKTLEFGSTVANGATGTSPKLASGATDNTSGTSLTPGTAVNRTTKTTGTIESAILSTIAFSGIGIESDFNPGSPPTLESYVNGVSDGTFTFQNIVGLNVNTGTNGSLAVTSDADYNLFNAAGQSIAFADTIYYPGAFGGFQAKVAETASTVPVGINSFQLRHTDTISPTQTNILEFVKDDLTSIPTLIDGSIIEGVAGTYRYISGIPYYNSGNPTIYVSGLQVENWIGQTYADVSNVLEVRNGLNYEGTTSAGIVNTNFGYADLNNGLSPYLSAGIPTANTGIGTPYTVAFLEVPITSSLVRTIDSVRFRMQNVNGFTGYTQRSTAISVHKSGQYGISEIAIAVDNSLGNGVFTDDAVRIFNFAANSVDNPAFNSSGVDYYTNNPYQESSDPGVVGTQEATIRLGVLEHNVIDYSADFLPVGPDRSGDTGRQYFTMAFHRQVVANFGINIASSTGVAGVWIAAPGTAIDSASSINGWLDCSIQYAGAGVPGGDSGNGGNGSNGCAITGGDIIATNTALSGQYNMTLGAENMSNATNNVVLVRIALDAGQKITTLEIKEV